MSSDRSTTPELRYAEAVDELDALEPIWAALQEHHARITPSLGPATPRRATEEAWQVRRSKYEHWLQEPDTFFVIASIGGAPVGYAFVTIGPPYASWATGKRLAELETLSVLASRRSDGIGASLLGAVWSRLERLGVEDMQITTTATNLDAQRFYERHGFRRRFVVYYGRSGRPAPADGGSRGRAAAGPCGRGALWTDLPGGSGLRLLELPDAAELHVLIEANREHLARWMPWAAGQTFDDTLVFIDGTRQQLETNDGFQVAIVRDERIVGIVGYHGVDWASRSTAIGYWLTMAEQGKGTMTEAIRVLIDHAFSAWQLNRVEIRVTPDNRRSLAIPQRLGFSHEGTLRKAQRIGERYVDLAVYSLLNQRS